MPQVPVAVPAAHRARLQLRPRRRQAPDAGVHGRGAPAEDAADHPLVPEAVHDAAAGQAGRLHVGGARRRARRGARAGRARHPPAVLQAQDEERGVDQGAQRPRREVPERLRGHSLFYFFTVPFIFLTN